MTVAQTKCETADAAQHGERQPSVNIAEHLSRMAAAHPEKRAVVCSAGRDADGRATYVHWTFRELDRETDRYAHGFERAGITRGTRTILMVKPGLEFFALTFALFKVGAVPVLIDPGMGRKNLVACLAHVKAEAFIGIRLAHLLRMLYPKAFRTVKVAVAIGKRLFWCGRRLSDLRTDPWRAYTPAATKPEEQAAILFTSGSTGPPKGVVYEHRMFDAQVRYLQSHYGYAPDEIDLATFPLFALFDVALGMTAVIPDMDASRPGSADPRKIVEAIQDQRCTQMFASPALLNRVTRHGEATHLTLPTLKRILTAGAPIQPSLLESLHKLLPDGALIHTPYGATECLPVCDIASREILDDTRLRTATGGGTCVGRPLDGMQVRIIEITDEPLADWANAHELPPGTIGEIVATGPVMTREYFDRPEATAAAKIPDRRSGRLWHRMGDVGYFDETGRLWFCGRKAHRVRTVAGTLFTVPCEAIFNQHARVLRTALVGVGEPGAQKPVLCVELEPNAAGDRKDVLTRELLELGAANDLTRNIRTILFHSAFPVDVRHNAKIFREKLAVWAKEKLG